MDPFLSSTRRLLKLAARRYRVELRPVTPLLEGADEDRADSYSLASVFALADLERAMVLQTPGLLLETERLDQALAYGDAVPWAHLAPDADKGVVGTEMLLLRPGKDVFAALRASESANSTTMAGSGADVDLLSLVLPEPLFLGAEQDENTGENFQRFLKSISGLHHVPISEPFNVTEWLHSTSYIRFSDEKLPKGPEYDVPFEWRRKARPQNKEADWIWTSLYGTFAGDRMGVCGLDLEVWRDWE